MSDQSADAKPGISLRIKLGVLVALVATLPVVIVGWLGLDANANTIKEGLLERQMLVLSNLTNTVDAELSDAEDGLVVLASALTNVSFDPDTRIDLAQAIVQARYSLDHVAVYDAAGELIDVIREGEADTEVPPRLAPELMAAAKTQRTATGEVVADEVALRITIAAAIRPNGGTRDPAERAPTGYVVSLVSTQVIQERVDILGRAHLGGGPEALVLVDRNLQILAHPDRARLLSSAAQMPALEGVDPATLDPGRPLSGEFDSSGAMMVATVIVLESRPWAAVAQIPRPVAYASLAALRQKVLVIVALVAVTAGGFGVLMAQRLTAPLKALTAFAAELAKRRFGGRVEVRSRDELGVLARAMSSAAAELEASEAKLEREISIRHDLGRYMPAEIVERVVNREQDMALGGERREISVLFMDVVAFTPLTERLEPESVVELLNHLFTMSTEIVFRHEGTVDKFIGDCMMALWGAPADCPDHAERAVAAAEEILSWLDVANQNFRERYDCTVRLAIGINSGPCIVGNIGSDRRMEYTAIGDVVNLAARLESIARPQQILISERTRELAEVGGFEFAAVGSKEIAGRTEPVELYEVRV